MANNIVVKGNNFMIYIKKERIPVVLKKNNIYTYIICTTSKIIKVVSPNNVTNLTPSIENNHPVLFSDEFDESISNESNKKSDFMIMMDNYYSHFDESEESEESEEFYDY
jgi:hypothetical protein